MEVLDRLESRISSLLGELQKLREENSQLGASAGLITQMREENRLLNEKNSLLSEENKQLAEELKKEQKLHSEIDRRIEALLASISMESTGADSTGSDQDTDNAGLYITEEASANYADNADNTVLSETVEIAGDAGLMGVDSAETAGITENTGQENTFQLGTNLYGAGTVDAGDYVQELSDAGTVGSKVGMEYKHAGNEDGIPNNSLEDTVKNTDNDTAPGSWGYSH